MESIRIGNETLTQFLHTIKINNEIVNTHAIDTPSVNAAYYVHGTTIPIGSFVIWHYNTVKNRIEIKLPTSVTEVTQDSYVGICEQVFDMLNEKIAIVATQGFVRVRALKELSFQTTGEGLFLPSLASEYEKTGGTCLVNQGRLQVGTVVDYSQHDDSIVLLKLYSTPVLHPEVVKNSTVGPTSIIVPSAWSNQKPYLYWQEQLAYNTTNHTWNIDTQVHLLNEWLCTTNGNPITAETGLEQVLFSKHPSSSGGLYTAGLPAYSPGTGFNLTWTNGINNPNWNRSSNYNIAGYGYNMIESIVVNGRWANWSNTDQRWNFTSGGGYVKATDFFCSPLSSETTYMNMHTSMIGPGSMFYVVYKKIVECSKVWQPGVMLEQIPNASGAFWTIYSRHSTLIGDGDTQHINSLHGVTTTQRYEMTSSIYKGTHTSKMIASGAYMQFFTDGSAYGDAQFRFENNMFMPSE